MTPALVGVLTASEDPTVHDTITHALSLLGGQDAASLVFLRANTAEETLAVARSGIPKVAFLDVTIGRGAGVGLVQLLQSTVPGLVVIAIAPEGAMAEERDVRLVEQAAALGASYLLRGELTGDDVLRAFTRVVPLFASDLSQARSFRELDGQLAALASAIPAHDSRAPLLTEVRSAIEHCVVAERAGQAERSPMQDPATSAYSFAYFVDLAGREIDLARRHGRRFALATVEIGPNSDIDTRAAVELALAAVRDTDVVARADEHELLLLLPETGATGARALRRRIIERVQTDAQPRRELPVRVGIASFPFDGEDLSRLLRVARRRAGRWAPIDAQPSMDALLAHALEWLRDPRAPGGPPSSEDRPSPEERTLVPIDMPLREAWALLDAVVRESTRAGDALIGLHAPQDASESGLGLAQGVRASTLDAAGPMTAPARSAAGPNANRDILSVISGVSRLREFASFSGLEVVGVLAEHACYGLVGRVDDGRLRALQAHDLPVVETLVNGLDQPTLRRALVNEGVAPSIAPTSIRTSRSDSADLRRE